MKNKILCHELRVEIFRQDITLQEIADICSITPLTLRRKLTGESTFTMDEVYAICDKLKLNYSLIPAIFPKRGTV